MMTFRTEYAAERDLGDLVESNTRKLRIRHRVPPHITGIRRHSN
jgi:hypothetical protein